MRPMRNLIQTLLQWITCVIHMNTQVLEMIWIGHSKMNLNMIEKLLAVSVKSVFQNNSSFHRMMLNMIIHSCVCGKITRELEVE